MVLRPVPFARQFYVDASLPISAQRLVNLYISSKPSDSKNISALLGTPGLVPWVEVGAGPIRGTIALGDYLFVVSGEALYRVDRFGSSVFMGAVAGVRKCSLAQDGLRLVVVSDSNIYWASTIDFGSLPVFNCVGVDVHDGYFLFAERGTQKFFVSDITAPKIDGVGNVLPPAFKPLEFTLVNAYPDNNKAIINSNRETWLLGENSAQLYYDSGAFDFPFSRMSGGVFQRGCIATNSVAQYQGSLFWLGDDKRVYTAKHAEPTVISTEAIDAHIAKSIAIEDAFGFVYSQCGRVFYVLTLSDATFVFDLDLQLWHERQSRGLSNWRIGTVCTCFDRLLVSDTVTNEIHELSLDSYVEHDLGLIRIATAPPIFGGGGWTFMAGFYLDMEVGVGLQNGLGSDPKVMLDWSDNGGFTYGNELWRTAGRIGDYKHRVEWRRLGRFQQRTMRVTISDPVKVTLIQAFADLEIGL